MIPLTAEQILQATQGSTLITGTLSTRITAVCTDSRSMKPQSLFIALKGQNHDAHQNLPQAVQQGAKILLVHQDIDPATFSDHAPGELTIIRVRDTRSAMGQLAHFVRNLFSQTRVIAVGGSNGKTGTKHLIHSLLKTRFRGSMSPKSFNNDIGVPLTLFEVQPQDDYVVVEIGTNHPGEVKYLSDLCQPDMAVITSIGEEHLEFFQDLQGVRQENSQIVSGLKPGGTVWIPGDDPTLRVMLPQARTFGLNDCEYKAYDIQTGLDGTHFCLNGLSFRLPQIGRHHALNALPAIGIARQMGLDNDSIREGLLKSSSPEMRMQKRVIGPVTLINDAYNANPTSVKAALETMAEIPWPGRKVVVLGQMRELGQKSADFHRSLKELARSLRFVCHFVGDDYRDQENWYANSVEAGEKIPDQLREGDLVLLKGSRGTRLELIEQGVARRYQG